MRTFSVLSQQEFLFISNGLATFDQKVFLISALELLIEKR